jgi:hypothetical protein
VNRGAWYRCVGAAILAVGAAACGSAQPDEKPSGPAWERENPIKPQPLGLKNDDVDAIVAFLESLDGEGYQDTPPTIFPQ